jgi:hypothetical protein
LTPTVDWTFNSTTGTLIISKSGVAAVEYNVTGTRGLWERAKGVWEDAKQEAIAAYNILESAQEDLYEAFVYVVDDIKKTTDARIFESVQQTCSALPTSAFEEVIIAGEPTVFLSSGAGDSGIGGVTGHITQDARYQLADNEVEVHINANVIGGFGEVWAWVGRPFIASGCDPTNQSESGFADFLFSGSFCGTIEAVVGAASAVRVTADLYDCTDGSHTSSEINFSDASIAEPSVSVSGAIAEHLDGLLIQEDHRYIAYISLSGRVSSALGWGEVNFLDNDDSSCLADGGGDAGARYSSISVTFPSDPPPDLVVENSDLTIVPDEAIQGQLVEFFLDVHNQTPRPINAVDVRFYDGGMDVGTTQAENLVACGGVSTAVLPWCADGIGVHAISGVVDPDDDLQEPDRTDNTALASMTVVSTPTRATAIVLDKSGSMNADIIPGVTKINIAKISAHVYVEQNNAQRVAGCVPEGDAVAVTNFATTATRTHPLCFALPHNTGCNDSPGGKAEAHDAVETPPLGSGSTAFYDGVAAGVRELCCMGNPLNTPLRTVVAITDGGDNSSAIGYTEVAAQACSCRTPIIVVTPEGVLKDIWNDLPLPDSATVRNALYDIALQSGGALYPFPANGDSASMDAVMQRIEASLADAADGVLVSPVGQPQLSADPGQYVGAISIALVGDTPWSGTLLLTLAAPPYVTFPSLPEVTVGGIPIDPGTIVLFSSIIEIPIPAPDLDECSWIINIGDRSGILVDIAPDYTGGPLNFTLDDGDLGFFQDEVTLANAPPNTSSVPEERTPGLPRVDRLRSNFPNPFNPNTTIQLELTRGVDTRLRIYDVRGHVVRDLVHAKLEAGIHKFVWDGRNSKGERAPTGIYIYRVVAGSFVDEKKMVMIK